MKKLGICIVFILVYFLGFSQVIILDSLAENGGYSYKSQPIGSGPFPGVLYSHGGLGNAVGGNLRGTCIALAQNGYMGWCNRRTTDIPMAPHVVQVEAALDSLLSQTDVDVNNIGIIGFSRGGLLTIMTAVSRYNDVKAVVTMAPAAANNTLANTLLNASSIDDSVLILVAENDTFQDNHVQLALDVRNALDTSIGFRHIEYPPYDEDGNGVVNNLDDGHMLFDKVQSPYWDDLIDFLDNNLKNTNTNIHNFPSKTKNKLINIVDLLGRKTNNKNNSLSFYIYDNGTVEKKITLE